MQKTSSKKQYSWNFIQRITVPQDQRHRDREGDRQQRRQQREQRSWQKRKKTEAVVFTKAEAVTRRRAPWREENEDRNSTEAPWLWSEDAYYFTATKKKRKTTSGETTTTTTTILHDFACSHKRDIRLKATTLSSTMSRILASTTTTDAGTPQSRLPCPTRWWPKKKKKDGLLKEFRELHTEEENICRDWSNRGKSYTEEICRKQLISQEKKSFFFFFLGFVMYFWSFWQRIHPSLAETVKHGLQLLLCMLNFVEEGKMGYKHIIESEVLQISYNCVHSAVLVWVRGFGYDADDDADDDQKPRSWIWLELFVVFSFTFLVCLLLGSLFWGLPIHGRHAY